jgi:translation elongation factor P/translation initiation factor 5A
MKRDKRAESLGKGDRIAFANNTLEVTKVVRFKEGKATKVRVSFKGFRDVEFSLEQLITIID